MSDEQRLAMNILRNGHNGAFAYIIKWQYEQQDESSWVELNPIDALLRVTSLLLGSVERDILEKFLKDRHKS